MVQQLPQARSEPETRRSSQSTLHPHEHSVQTVLLQCSGPADLEVDFLEEDLHSSLCAQSDSSNFIVIPSGVPSNSPLPLFLVVHVSKR